MLLPDTRKISVAPGSYVEWKGSLSLSADALECVFVVTEAYSR